MTPLELKLRHNGAEMFSNRGSIRGNTATELETGVVQCVCESRGRKKEREKEREEGREGGNKHAIFVMCLL